MIALALATLLGCGEKDAKAPDAVHVILRIDDPIVSPRAAEIDDIVVDIQSLNFAPIETHLAVPAGAFSDGVADFDFEYGDRTGPFDLYVTAGTDSEAFARGELFELPLEPGDVELPLGPFTSRWYTGETIDQEEGEDGAGPRAAIDGDGLVTVVWTSDRDVVTNGGVFGAGWDGTSVLANEAGNASHARIALDGDGAAYLVWQQLDVAESVWALRRPAGGAWAATPEEMDYNDDNVALAPEIAANAAGDAASTYLQRWYEKPEVGDALSVWAAFDDGTQFPDAEPLDLEMSVPITASALALRADGRAFVLWQTESDGLWWNHIAEGESPEDIRPTITALDETADASMPRAAADADGNVFAAWVSGGAVHVSVEDDLAWVDTALPDFGEGEIGDLEIVGDGLSGVALVVVRGGRVWAASWLDEWTTPIEVGPVAGDAEPDVALASDGNGGVLAVFVGVVGENRVLWASERSEPGWQSPAVVAIAREIASPQCALNGAGNGLAVWESRDAGRTRILAALRTP